MTCKHGWDEELFSCPDCRDEYKEWEALNLVKVAYGFGWARQGDASTHPLENILDSLNKEVNTLKVDSLRQFWDNEKLRQQLNEKDEELGKYKLDVTDIIWNMRKDLEEKDKEIEMLKALIVKYVEHKTIISHKDLWEVFRFE